MDVTIQAKDNGQWVEYAPFKLYVAVWSIDPLYRLSFKLLPGIPCGNKDGALSA